MSLPQIQPTSQWPHRAAVVLVCATFPLLWVGGLVTTYDAGMAVPDWPTTYGYNLFLYPWQTWVYGPWNLFVEHGHRLLGAVVGLLTIGFCVLAWSSDRRAWLRWLALGALGLVVVQGVLGGLRVVLDARSLALIHGCVGPLFFALCTALAVCTSPRWLDSRGPAPHRQAGKLHSLAVVTTALAYLQLVLGAHLRHLPATAGPGFFRAALLLHLLTAGVLVVHVFLIATRTLAVHRGQRSLVWPSLALVGLIAAQVALGGAAYVTNYGWPAWSASLGFGTAYVVAAKSALQAHVTTAHAATGSLILATSLVLTLRSLRLLRSDGRTVELPIVAGAPG